jgi:hypothetical protein
MDYDGESFDVDSEPVRASQNKAGMITLVAMQWQHCRRRSLFRS